MASLAAEMNLSETAFLVSRAHAGWDLRWFTPTNEVDLCGHATLASAHMLWTEAGAAADTLVFHTRSGELRARREGERITLDLPADPAVPGIAPPGLQQAIGVAIAAYGRSSDDQLVELATEDAVRALSPNVGALASLGGQGVIVTAPASTDGLDFVSRYFAPGVGIPEDPVTGAAHCTLTPWWAERLGMKEMRAYQASTRGGYVDVRLTGDRVELTGRAVTVFRGSLA